MGADSGVEVTGLEYSTEEPLNREPPVEDLVKSFLTTSDAYDRNHGPIPHINPSTHTLTLDGLVRTPTHHTFSSLQQLRQHTVICALQCAGNRRHTMRTSLKEVQGIDWFDGAVMNCIWKGPRLSELLRAAGVLEELDAHEKERAHVSFSCHQMPCQEDTWYGASIPLSRALDDDADVIVALEMNDGPLTPAHGAPMRIIVPGIAGARSVKWVNRITVQMVESSNYYQQHDYKILPPEAEDTEGASVRWHTTPALQEMPVNSVIGIPPNGSTVERDSEGMVNVKGYALPSGSDGPVVKVEVSVDEGKSWVEAEIMEAPEELKGRGRLLWAWSLWIARVKIEKGEKRRILSRATDRAGIVQPGTCQWNLRGVAYNGYGEASDLTVK